MVVCHVFISPQQPALKEDPEKHDLASKSSPTQSVLPWRQCLVRVWFSQQGEHRPHSLHELHWAKILVKRIKGPRKLFVAIFFSFYCFFFNNFKRFVLTLYHLADTSLAISPDYVPYKLALLMQVNVSQYAIRVGTATLEDLDIDSKLDPLVTAKNILAWNQISYNPCWEGVYCLTFHSRCQESHQNLPGMA